MTAVKSRLPSYLLLEDELGKSEPDKVSQESYIAVIMYRYLLPIARLGISKPLVPKAGAGRRHPYFPRTILTY